MRLPYRAPSQVIHLPVTRPTRAHVQLLAATFDKLTKPGAEQGPTLPLLALFIVWAARVWPISRISQRVLQAVSRSF
jgi:hypothetical protein